MGQVSSELYFTSPCFCSCRSQLAFNPGSYSVLHAIRPATNKVLPRHIAAAVPESSDILEAEISFDFGLVKRDSGDIYIRIDYSNSADYWKSIVQGDSVKSSKSKRSSAPLHERFYSSAASDWKARFDKIRQASKYEEEQSIDRLGMGSIHKSAFNVLLSGESAEKCSATGADGFLKMGISGSLHEALEFGYSFVGVISPTFKIEQAYGYYDTHLLLSGSLDFNGKGSLDIPSGMAAAKLFTQPRFVMGFLAPGHLQLWAQA